MTIQETVSLQLINKQSIDYNMLKAIEESSEFTEQCVKYLTRKDTKHPINIDRLEILKEYADVVFRGSVAMRQLLQMDYGEIKEFVDNYLDMKCVKLLNKLS